LRTLEFVEKELIEIWEMLSSKEKRNEKQFYKFLELQRSVRAMKEALASMAKHNGYFKYEEIK
jgi:hypothetical protein